MRRITLLVAVALVMATMMLVAAAPAFAATNIRLIPDQACSTAQEKSPAIFPGVTPAGPVCLVVAPPPGS